MRLKEWTDTAVITATDEAPDPSAYSVEADGDILYPAYEFVYDRDGGRQTIRSKSITSESQQRRSCHLDNDLFIEHKLSNEQIAVEYIEEVLAHWGDAQTTFDFSIRDL